MQTIKISAYTDKDFSQQHGSALELPMEPEQISFGNSIHYRDDRQLGSTGGDIRFEKYGPATLSLKFTIDCTGVVEGHCRVTACMTRSMTLLTCFMSITATATVPLMWS